MATRPLRFELELVLDLPRERVVQHFLAPDNLFKWQPDLVSVEPLSDGDPRAVGAKSRQTHKMGRREVAITETITVHNPPSEFSAVYEDEGMWNLVENRFTVLDGGHTHWHLTFECKSNDFVTRVMMALLPFWFKRQTRQFMERFKAFAESQ